MTKEPKYSSDLLPVLSVDKTPLDTAIPNPHDAFFKSLMDDIRIARRFFEIHLPERYQAKCDFSTLQLKPGSFVESNLQQQFSDVLYGMTVKGKTTYLYCLIEHVTQPKQTTAFQMLRYQIAAMHQHMQQGHTQPPLVIPLLFYRGKKSPYPFSLEVYDCFDDPEAAREVLSTHLLVDISVIPDEEIATHQGIALLELLQKHITTRDLIELIPY